MKRFLSLLCALAVLLSAAACGSNKTSVLPTDETKAADGVSTDASADSDVTHAPSRRLPRK